MNELSETGEAAQTATATRSEYRVLARKYRPASFSELIGQEAMVRTLSNAIESGRLAHAFILTGVRGVGKTTTARLIARALNCTGEASRDGPTISPCGVCDNCVAIAESRHVDVLEMDAASHTGVDDVREIIDAVRYAPAVARYKVYIIDEVHMLSRSAFNALLKTLEEPPAHVVFIFATTEIRKVPVTVLSRCQRFDLRRVDGETLMAHLRTIAGREGVEIEAGALGLIVRTAEGSVRDALSLLDQAIAHGAGTIAEAAVADMLGLADRMRIYDLFEAALAGQVGEALAVLRDLYDAGADPIAALQDLLEVTHGLSRLKMVPEAAEDVTIAESERTRAAALAAKLSMPTLGRTWQMLLKGLDEARRAPSALAAAEMVLIRLAHMADLPDPAELVRRARNRVPASAQAAPAPPKKPPASSPVAHQPPPDSGPVAGAAQAPELARQSAPAAPRPRTFEEVVDLVGDHHEAVLQTHLLDNVRLVRFQPGRIEIQPTPKAPADLANRLGKLLTTWTGERWVVTVSQEEGGPTLREQQEAAAARALDQARAHPVVQAALELFPGAEIVDVRDVAVLDVDIMVGAERDTAGEGEGA